MAAMIVSVVAVSGDEVTVFLSMNAAERSFDLLGRIAGALQAANEEMTARPAAAGGLGGLWRLTRAPENQETLRFLLALGRSFWGRVRRG